MVYIRILLFSGLVLHKLVWELMKRSEGLPDQAKKKPANFGLKSLVKLGKSLFLLFLIVQTLLLNIFPISDSKLMLQIAGIVIYLVGLALAITGRIQLGNNWANLEDYQVLPDQSLVNKGVYRYIRHPIYIGDVLLILGLELALNSWLVVVAIILFGFVFSQAKSEEKVLSRAFPGYEEYRKQTKMFIPYLI